MGARPAGQRLRRDTRLRDNVELYTASEHEQPEVHRKAAKLSGATGRCDGLDKGDSEFRVFYVARFEEAVYVLHCFVKKTQATRKADIDLGKQRYATLREARKSK